MVLGVNGFKQSVTDPCISIPKKAGDQLVYLRKPKAL